MKKNVILSIVGVLLVLGIGISFAYYVSQVLISGDGSDVSVTPGEMIKVTYDAGGGIINSEGMVPGDIATKNFTVTVTPTEKEKEATYSIILNITENTFVKCDDSNYNDITNACQKDAEELVYRLKDSDNQVIAEGSLMGVTGEIKLITETKTVDVQTTYNYTLEIEFIDTGYDQNHNQNKIFNGSVEVEFDEVIPAKDYILANYDTVLTRSDFNTTVEETTTGTIYKSLDETQYDNDGEVYYFAGNPTDNWVQFGGYYWRIIRINGNGSIRMIYQGTAANTTGTGTQIGTSAFNNSNNDNAYVGLKYTSNNVHGTGTNSTILTALNSWYSSNLSSYADDIDGNAGFCGDRTPSTSTSSSNGQGGTGTTTTYYGAYIRLNTNKTSTFECPSEDLYTTSGSSDGNRALQYPIGLISADEVAYAGGVWVTNNTSYYLYTRQNYWIMSPSYYPDASVFAVSVLGDLGSDRVNNTLGVRPVINLKADVQLTGSGTASDPYVVVRSE